jgi:hypothetical protein
VEDFGAPLQLCPVDLRKMAWRLAFSVPGRFRAIKAFADAHGWKEDAGWLRRWLAKHEKSGGGGRRKVDGNGGGGGGGGKTKRMVVEIDGDDDADSDVEILDMSESGAAAAAAAAAASPSSPLSPEVAFIKSVPAEEIDAEMIA